MTKTSFVAQAVTFVLGLLAFRHASKVHNGTVAIAGCVLCGFALYDCAQLVGYRNSRKQLTQHMRHKQAERSRFDELK